MKLGKFPFTYLGAPISPFRLPARHFQPLIDNTASTINNWNHTHISQAGRVILINSNIFALPVYLLSVFFLPDLILDSISKLARAFLWGRNGNHCRFHSIGWTTVTLPKSEGGLGLRNLRNARLALFAKHVFSIANNSDKIWVSIFRQKYHNWNIWNNTSSAKTSDFFKAISKTATFLGPYFKLSVCNPNYTNVCNDPWILDIPLNRKPTFFSMDYNINLNIHSFISDSSFNLHTCSDFFGGDLNNVCLNDVVFDTSYSNDWVWLPNSSNVKTVTAVYNFINSDGAALPPWAGWNQIWKLMVIPRIKLFVWKVAHGKLPISASLYNLNPGPISVCHFCGLHPETTDHLLWYCRCSLICWNTVFCKLGLDSNFINLLAQGSWLTTNFNCNTNCDFARAVFASFAWLIWTSRCNFIFKQLAPNFPAIPDKAWSFAHNVFTAKGLSGLRTPSFSRPSKLSIFVSTNAAWDLRSGSAGYGFIIYTNFNSVLLAGAAGEHCSSSLEAELKAIAFLLRHCCLNGWVPDTLSRIAEMLFVFSMISITSLLGVYPTELMISSPLSISGPASLLIMSTEASTLLLIFLLVLGA